MKLLLIGPLLFFFLFVPGQTMADTEVISVTASYRERIALPPDAVLEVQLLDVSRADAPAIQIASLRFKMDRTPITVELPYDPAVIDPRMTYSVRATVLSGDEVLFRTTTANPVLTRGASRATDLMLRSARADASGASVAGVAWAVTEIGGKALIAEDPPELRIDADNGFSAYGGCNTLRGRVEMSGSAIRFPAPIAATQMICPEPRMKLEADFLDALGRTAALRRDGALLAFMNTAGVTVLRFRERPE
jgi:putative lipoprotein